MKAKSFRSIARAIVLFPFNLLMGVPAAPAGTLTTYAATGLREDITDDISIITPLDAKFYNAIGTGTVKARKHEFLTDALAAPQDNAAVEGADPSIQASTQPVKVYNNVQIQEKSFSVSSTANAVDSVDDSATYDYQKSKKMKELAGDMEYAYLRGVRVDGDANTAAKMRGALNWCISNLDKAADAVLNADGTIAGGTARELNKDMVNGVMQNIYTSGGGDKMLTAYCGVFQKSRFDQFYTGTNMRRAIDKDTVDDKIDIYVTSFGTVKAEINRTMPTDQFGIFDLTYFKKCTLIPAGVSELATSSRLNKKYHMTVEHTLRSKNEAASGRITNLTTM